MSKLTIKQEDIKYFNNLYRISKDNFEKYDIIEAEDVIHKTKFYKLLLKEWFECVKIGGELHISIKEENKILNNWGIRQIIFALLNDYIEYDSEEVEKTTIHKIKKIKSTKVEDDDISRWSFGIVTNGTRVENVEKLIDSIVLQKIPSYEIIICGKINNSILEKYNTANIVYIEFTQRDKLGWITKKKNLICERAKYNNIAIFHDRFVLDIDWYKGMQEYGNNFEVLSCSNVDLKGKRVTDWGWTENQFNKLEKGWIRFDLLYPFLLEYTDWDDQLYISGGSTILKKHLWKQVSWDDRRHWIEEEDTLLSHMQIMKGIIPRHNIYAKHITLVSKNNFVQTVSFSSYHTKLSFLQKMKFFRSLFVRKNKFLRKFFYND